MQTSQKKYDLIIIGAGPVGLYASFLAGYFKLEVLCLERDQFIGGQATKIYPFKQVIDFPGQLSITATDLVQNLVNQAQQFSNVSIVTNVNIVSYELQDEMVILYDDHGQSYYTKDVLLTVGLGAFEPIALDANLVQGSGAQIHYTHDNMHDCTNQRVVILGGGDSAVEYAYIIKQQYPSAHVSLVHRSETLRAIVHSKDELNHLGVKVILNAQLNNVNDHICFINYQETMISLPYDYLLVQFGLKSLGSNIHNWPDFKRYNLKFLVDHHYATSVPHFYAVGTCSYNPYKIDMIATGMSEATIAINYLYSLKHKGNNKPFYSLKHK